MVPSISVGVRRALVVLLDAPLPPSLALVQQEFRLLINQAIREADARHLTARGSLVPFAQTAARELHLNFHHARRAADLALSLLKGHRRRLRHGRHSSLPFVRRPLLNATDATFHLDPILGKVRVSLRAGEWTSFVLPLAAYHRAALADPKVRVKELVIATNRVSVVVEKEVPPEYHPTTLFALDTNEASLDGVRVTATSTTPVTVPFPAVRVIQQRHFARRRRLARTKASDRRVARRLLRREGLREHHRVRARLHRLSKALVDTARRQHAALVLERLKNLPVMRRGSSRLRRRLSSWPRRELHRQLLYKAEERGVPVFLVNPRNTSRTCPRCGVIQERRRRVAARFDCAHCDWSLDRQVNAGVNLARTVLAETRELGGLRVDLDALPHEVVTPLCAAEAIRGARAERMGREALDPALG